MEERKSRGVRTQRRKCQNRKKTLKTIKYIIGYIIIGILAYMFYGFYVVAKFRTVEKGKNETVQLSQNKVEENAKKQASCQEEVIPVSKQYKGYLVEARLEIPKIELNTNVLSDYTKQGLKVCASKYYGPNANEVGNYCIAGHNYNKKNMFNNLIRLKIGDSIFLTDNINGKVEYSIYDIYKVKPENTEPLSQETRGEKEITLITCVNYSSRRLVVKAIEKNA